MRKPRHLMPRLDASNHHGIQSPNSCGDPEAYVREVNRTMKERTREAQVRMRRPLKRENPRSAPMVPETRRSHRRSTPAGLPAPSTIRRRLAKAQAPGRTANGYRAEEWAEPQVSVWTAYEMGNGDLDMQVAETVPWDGTTAQLGRLMQPYREFTVMLVIETPALNFDGRYFDGGPVLAVYPHVALRPSGPRVSEYEVNEGWYRKALGSHWPAWAPLPSKRR